MHTHGNDTPRACHDPQGAVCPVPEPSLRPCARPLEQLKRAGETPAPALSMRPPAFPPSLIRVIAMEICHGNTEKLELPSGGEDLKGPQIGGWPLLCPSASTPQRPPPSLGEHRLLPPPREGLGAMSVLVDFLPKGTVLRDAAPVPCFSCSSV